MLSKVDGPACPRCGCRHSSPLLALTRWGQSVQKRGCRNCGKVFTVNIAKVEPNPVTHAAPPEVTHDDVDLHDPIRCRCRHCGSTNTKVTRTMPDSGGTRLRYHACNACGQTFKSADGVVSG